MQLFAYLAIAGAVLFQGVAAVPATTSTITTPAPSTPTSFPGHYVCKSITTVTTTEYPHYQCKRQVCLKPTRTCNPGEPTQAPYPATTTTPLPGCTVSVTVDVTCGCPTCLPRPTA
ncbi:hypothetical protein F4779DRAFT_594154 [Xylariaceae sp. FL0662B]|nr:hypothetical protein F4779DRAFT_594154 [Xylariaceae sp. FL0662B]